MSFSALVLFVAVLDSALSNMGLPLLNIILFLNSGYSRGRPCEPYSISVIIRGHPTIQNEDLSGQRAANTSMHYHEERSRLETCSPRKAVPTLNEGSLGMNKSC